MSAAPTFPKKTGRVAVVKVNEGLVFVRELMNSGEIGDHAIHGKGTIAGDEFVPTTSLIGSLELFFEILEVVVCVAVSLRLAEADAINDGGVVERIGDDGIVSGEESFKKTAVGIEAGRVKDGIFSAKVFAEGLFKLAVEGLGATDKADGSDAKSIGGDRLPGRLADFGMVSEPEVVIRAHVNDASTILEGDFGVLSGSD